MDSRIKIHFDAVRALFTDIFSKYLTDLKNENTSSEIFKNYLMDMSKRYRDNHKNSEIVRDFISGMTEQYFLRLCPENTIPAYINI